MRLLRFIFLVMAFAATCHAQTVFSANATSYVYARDHRSWMVESGSGRYGLNEFSELDAAKDAWVTRTTVWFGAHNVTLRLPAWAVMAIGATVISSAVLLGIALAGKARRPPKGLVEVPLRT